MNVMLIDDDQECLECLSKALRLNDFGVQAHSSASVALQAYQTDTVDVVITDFHLPDTTGIEILRTLHLKNPTVPVIITSGDTNRDIETQALHAGALAFFRKPMNISSLITIMNSIPPKKTTPSI